MNDAIADGLVARTQAAFAAGGPLSAAFDGYVARAQQIELAGLVAEALGDASTAVAEAGTGVGKTFAYLVPALLADGKVVVSSGTRTLQDQLCKRDLPALQRALGCRASVALLKGRANYVCRHHLRRHLADGRFARREQAEQLRRIEWFARGGGSGDRADCASVPEDSDVWAMATSTRDNCLGQDCPDWNECFVVRARQAAQTADIVVVNHHLFCADAALRDEGVSELLPTANAVIFDEAHLLPEIGSLFFGVALSARQITELAGDAAAAGVAHARDAADWPALSGATQLATGALRAEWPLAALRADAGSLLVDRRFARAADALHDALRRLQAALTAAAPRHVDLQRCAARADDLCTRLQAWLIDPTDAPPQDRSTDTPPRDRPADGPRVDRSTGAPLRDRLPDASPPDRAPGSDAPGDGSTGGDPFASDEPPVRWAEAHAQSVTLHRTPVSVAGPFARYRDSTRCAWVFVSATLALGGDFSHFVQALGLAGATCRRWDSPFDFARQTRLYLPTDCGDPQHPAFTDRVIASAWPLLQANRGRAFVLCTSLRAVRRAAQVLRERLGPGGSMTLLVQGELARAELLRRFHQAPAPVLVGAASFWQGIDVRGERLSLVVIDKLPFASPDDPVLQARMRALRRAGRDPFTALQLPAAAVALKQGAGRLIRSERDRGVLMIGDERLVTRAYGRRLLASLPPFPVTRDPREAVAFLPGAVATLQPADAEAADLQAADPEPADPEPADPEAADPEAAEAADSGAEPTDAGPA